MRTKQLLTKSLLLVAGLLMGATNAWADKTYSTILSTDYSADADVATWVSGNTGRYKVSKGGDESNYYVLVSAVSNGNNGTAITNTVLTSLSTYLAADDYKIEFDFNFQKNANQAAYFQIFDTEGAELVGFYQNAANAAGASVRLSANGSATGGTELGTYTIDYDVASMNHVVITANATDGTNITFTPNGGSEATYKLSDDLVYIGKMVHNTKRYYNAFCFDNLVVSQAVAAGYVGEPTAAITGINGVNRTITMTQGDGKDIYYYVTGDDYATDGLTPVKYTEPLSISTTTYYVIYATDGTNNSTSAQYTFEAGEAITLNTPTWVRTGANTYTVSATETSAYGVTATQTIHYTINGGAEQTLAAPAYLTDVDGDIVAWAEADGFSKSADINIAYVAPLGLGDPAWSYNLNSYPSSHSCTAIANAIDASTETTLNEKTVYNLALESYPNLYVENAAGWLLRNQANSAWKAQSAEASIVINNVTTNNVIVVNGTNDKSDKAGVSAVANGTIAYNYNLRDFYIVPESDGAVTITFATGTAVNDIAVYNKPATETVPVTVSSVGYATFSSDKNLDFTNAKNIKAYTAKISDNTVTFTRIYQVPAGTGVLLWASGGATENIPVIESATSVDNDFKVAPYDMYKSDLSEGGKVYVLGNGVYGIGFYQPGEGFVLPKGKCYLLIPEEARIFIMPGMEGTGISATQVNSGATKSAIYNLNGQRIGKLQKGLNIVGGKKVIVK